MTPLALAFFVTAFLYASVGFGGGSTYIALLVLTGVSATLVPVIAPIANIIVVTGGTIRFARAKLMPWRRVIPLVLASAPMAYLGGLTLIKEKTFLTVLGVSLLIAGVLLLVQRARTVESAARRDRPLIDAGLGGAVGYLSGLVGIGGGIFLAPIQHFIRWGTSREIAATASLFILVNAIAGLAGQLTKLGLSGVSGVIPYWPLALAVLLGGQLGTHFGLKIFSQGLLRRATGLLILYVASQLLWKVLAG